jgi:hypothetical protein
MYFSASRPKILTASLGSIAIAIASVAGSRGGGDSSLAVGEENNNTKRPTVVDDVGVERIGSGLGPNATVVANSESESSISSALVVAMVDFDCSLLLNVNKEKLRLEMFRSF